MTCTFSSTPILAAATFPLQPASSAPYILLIPDERKETPTSSRTSTASERPFHRLGSSPPWTPRCSVQCWIGALLVEPPSPKPKTDSSRLLEMEEKVYAPWRVLYPASLDSWQGNIKNRPNPPVCSTAQVDEVDQVDTLHRHPHSVVPVQRRLVSEGGRGQQRIAGGMFAPSAPSDMHIEHTYD
ncbi:hypothetical protein C8Q74DRAFT_1436403, partial [Fomes fomentarius]